MGDEGAVGAEEEALGEDGGEGTEVSRMRRRAVKISREGGEVQSEARWPRVLGRGGIE